MPMFDGFRTLLGFSNMPTTNFAEVNVKPFGLDGRGPIDTTSMRNLFLTTKWPKQLTDFTPVQSDCQWDPILLPRIFLSVLLVNQFITVTMPNGDIFGFYGWCDKAEPQPQKEGEVPIIQFTIVPSNINDSGFESSPTYNGVAFI